MEAHDRAVDQALCRRGPSNATITSEALMTALADGRSQVPSADPDRGPEITRAQGAAGPITAPSSGYAIMFVHGVMGAN